MTSYAGIGSRKTPVSILETMENIAASRAELGHTLRTGGAAGADDAFLRGCVEHNGMCELYLPWPGFQGRRSPFTHSLARAFDIAAEFHPAWHRCSQGARKLHARNVHIMLGPDLDDPVSTVICWTPDGGPTGGTGMGIRIAERYGIPISNLFYPQE